MKARSRLWPRRKVILWTIVGLVLFYIAYNAVRVAGEYGRDESRQADAIVVFGAAEYAGRPSPIFKARLDHAHNLYKQGLAPIVITTGGHRGDDDTFTEGGVGRDYLVAQGIPSAAVIAETQSSDTSDSAERVGAIMKTNKLRTCLAVSDPYHIHRIKVMLAAEDVTTYGAPRPLAKPLSAPARLALYLREVLSLTLWRLGLK